MDSFSKIKRSYEGAEFILTDSEHSVNFIKNLFPKCKNRIIKINFSIDSKKFKINKKKNIISYMTRKLPDHSSILMFYIKDKIPKNWKFEKLENLKEQDLLKKLGDSKIFLSFSNFEGIGMPPIEAAIAGNKVIGYHGEGGLEYWKKPIFFKINNGDIFTFGKKILKEINSYSKNWIKSTRKVREEIISQYSKKKETELLISLSKVNPTILFPIYLRKFSIDLF